MRCLNKIPALAFAVAGFLPHLAMAAPYQDKGSPTSRCDLKSDGSVEIADVQTEVGAALGNIASADNLHNYDLNNDGWVNVVDIENEMNASLNMGCPADSTSPAITGFTPASGKAGQTVTVTVAGQGLYGAVLALQSVDPAHLSGATSITAVSEAGSTATFSVALGTEGAYNLIATNFVGASPVSQASSSFLILPATSAVSSYASVLNTSVNPATLPSLPAGQNEASFYASVLNTSFNSATLPSLPVGQNDVTSYASVLNASFNPATIPPLPAGQNDVSFYASVLNTSLNPATIPPLPAGRNDVSFYASVLNTAFNPASIPPLPAGQNAVATLGVSICNTASGCAAQSPATVTADASRRVASSRTSLSSAAPSRNLPAELAPLEERTTAVVGQTIRLEARNADPGSTVKFDVNQSVISTVNEPPYETLFTVPYGPDELAFQVEVEGPDQTERRSPVIRIAVVADSGAPVSGSVAEGVGGIALSLAAGGLKEEFFHLPQPVTGIPSLDGLEPVRTGYATAINQPNPQAMFGDDPLGARLSPDYAVRFSGELRAAVSGQYRFWLAARSGASVRIDGRPLADSGFVSGEPAEAEIAVPLVRGWHSLEVVYYLAVGASSVRLEWQPPNAARREVLGPESLRTALGMRTVSATGGEFAFPPIPAKFDSVWIRVAKGDGMGEFPAVKPGATQVLISVSK
jgi:hypothetical protein